MWQEEKQQQAGGARGLACEARGRYQWRVADINGAWMRVAARAREIETLAGAWRRV